MNALNIRFAKARGMSLVELLVSLTIGSLLIVGAVFVYSQSQTTSRVSDTVARLQENGRFIMALMEPDIQLAGAFGYNNEPTDTTYTGGIPISDMRQDDDKFTTAPAAAHECGDNFALDLIMTAEGREDSFGLDCDAFGAGAAVGADTLIIRRASATPSPENPDVLQLYAKRLYSFQQVLFSGTTPGELKDDELDVRNLIVNVYYVSRDSDGRAGFPSLRRKWLGLNEDGEYHMNDQEVMAGVEDFQVQFGVDLGLDADDDGTIDDDNDDGIADAVNGQAVRYVNPTDTASLLAGQVVSVRMWVRLRADQGEVGYTNNQTYAYGTTNFPANDNIRRLLISRTFFLRNSRVMKE